MTKKKIENSFKIFRALKKQNIDNDKMEEAVRKSSYLKEYAGSFLLILDMFKACVKGNFKLSPRELATFTGAILYVVLPIDSIPDYIPFIGYVDDIVILKLVMQECSNALARYRKFSREDQN